MIYESNIKNQLERLGISADVFCLLAGISPSRWSRAQRGLAPLSGPECEALSRLVEELSNLVEDAKPYILSFRNPECVKALLEQRRQGLRLILIPLGPARLCEQFESEKAKNS